MKKWLLKIKNILMGACLVLIMLMFNELSTKQVEAATFNRDSYTIAIGDELYLPYLAGGLHTEYYTDDDSDNPVAAFMSDDPMSFGYNALVGNKQGSLTVYAVEPDGSYDTMTLHVTERASVSANTVTPIAFELGQACRELKLVVPENGKYRFTFKGWYDLDLCIYDEQYNVVAYATEHGHTSSYDYTVMEADLVAGKLYYIDLLTYTSDSMEIGGYNPVAGDMVLELAIEQIIKATGVSLHVNAYALKIENDTYYMLEGDTFDVKVVLEGGANVQKENYDIGTTNSAVATITNFGGEDDYMINCHTAGEVDVSVTTANMLTDSFKLVVIGKDQLVPGDMDLDGIITKADIVNVYLAMTGQTEKTRIYYHADVNGDGTVTDADIAALWESIGGLPFVDVSETDWFYEAVEYNYDEGIMTGMNGIQFGPYESLSRAQFALILYRMQGTPEVTVENPFEDIAGNEWYADAVLWAYDNGIVTGFGDNTFRPADLITREQMVAMMYRYANYLEEDTTKKEAYDHFIDASNVSEYADEAMQWAVGNGILTGKNSEEGAMLAPWGATARAEAVVIIQRFMD